MAYNTAIAEWILELDHNSEDIQKNITEWLTYPRKRNQFCPPNVLMTAYD